MAYYDYVANRIVHYPSAPVEGRPGWVMEDCGCCNGLEWNTLGPVSCHSCGGSGVLYLHEKTGLLFRYIGGPIVGRRSKPHENIAQRQTLHHS